MIKILITFYLFHLTVTKYVPCTFPLVAISETDIYLTGQINTEIVIIKCS